LNELQADAPRNPSDDPSAAKNTILRLKRVGAFPFPKSQPEARRGNFSEVQQSYTLEDAMAEADRCVKCGDPHCIAACPVHTDVRGMCDAVAVGDFEMAYHRVRETNAFMGVTARCCPQLDGLCEEACVLGLRGEPVAIGMIQRFVADWERARQDQQDPVALKETGKLVSIVGAGPAGLAAAELLRRYGHAVKVYDELPTPGGTAWYGIPDYHLPKDVLQYEIDRIRGMGVEIRTGVRVGQDVSLLDLLAESDAVLVATGSKDVVSADTPGANLKGVYDGYEFLEKVFVNGVKAYLANPTYNLGSEILVIGGGDSALDSARTALRLTQGHVTIVYRRTEREMPADRAIIDEAKEEGIEFKFLLSPKSFNGTDGRLGSATMTMMKLGAPDASGRRSPEPIPGQEIEMKCDSVIVAIGRGPSTFLQKHAGLKTGKKGAISVDSLFRTSITGVFAAGDVITGESLVVKAMGQGRQAAQCVHEYLLNSEGKCVSLYDYYYRRRTFKSFYQDMLAGKEDALPPL